MINIATIVLSQITDYAKFYFECEVLPKIIGVTSFDKLKDLMMFVTWNIASSLYELGDIAHGRLGIVDDGASYF